MNVVEHLASALPSRVLQTDPDVMASYSRDQAAICEAGRPCAVVLAHDEDQIATVLRIASQTHTPVVVRGAGTGLSGGANAIDGGIVLSVAGLDAILDLDPIARLARVQPGVLNATLDAAAREHGLFYAPDPASRDISTIGGNVATNAGGACCLKYGVTGDHVARLRALLADGTSIHTGSHTLKNVAGLDLNRLLIGSEGTLAVITEITVRLLPTPPATGTLIAFFDDLAHVGPAIVALAGQGTLCRLEVMDRTTIRAVEDLLQMDLDTDAAAMLLAQTDVADVDAVLAASEQLCESQHASMVYTTADEEEGRLFMQARSAALPALEKRGQWLLDDVAVPVPRIPELLALCTRIAEQTGLVIGTFGHAGDGNLHPTVLYEGPEEEARALEAFDAILRGTLDLDGTITGEHGVGQLKQGYVRRMVGEREQALMRGIKGVFDPAGILNPGRAY